MQRHRARSSPHIPVEPRCSHQFITSFERATSRVGFDNDFPLRNTTFMAGTLIHPARLLSPNGGVPPHDNQRSQWEAGCRFDLPTPEPRQANGDRMQVKTEALTSAPVSLTF